MSQVGDKNKKVGDTHPARLGKAAAQPDGKQNANTASEFDDARRRK